VKVLLDGIAVVFYDREKIWNRIEAEGNAMM